MEVVIFNGILEWEIWGQNYFDFTPKHHYTVTTFRFVYSEQEAFELETLTSTVGFYSLAACKVVQLFLCNYGRTLKFAKALLFRNSNIPPSVPSCMQLSFLFYVISSLRPFDGRLISAMSYVSRIDYLMTAVTLIHQIHFKCHVVIYYSRKNYLRLSVDTLCLIKFSTSHFDAQSGHCVS